MPRRTHQFGELIAKHPKQAPVIAALEVDDLMPLQLFVNDRFDAPCHAHRRHRTTIAIAGTSLYCALGSATPDSRTDPGFTVVAAQPS